MLKNFTAPVLLKSTFIICILLASLSVTCQNQIKKGNLKVVLTDIKTKTGQVGFFLFHSEEGFPVKTEKALLSGYVKNTGKTVEYTFPNIAVGSYAVYVFHDEDGNNKLKTNFIGMPKEGMGVSNNAKGHFGPPSFDDAKFNFNKTEQTITVSLIYL